MIKQWTAKTWAGNGEYGIFEAIPWTGTDKCYEAISKVVECEREGNTLWVGSVDLELGEFLVFNANGAIHSYNGDVFLKNYEEVK